MVICAHVLNNRMKAIMNFVKDVWLAICRPWQEVQFTTGRKEMEFQLLVNTCVSNEPIIFGNVILHRGPVNVTFNLRFMTVAWEGPSSNHLIFIGGGISCEKSEALQKRGLEDMRDSWWTFSREWTIVVWVTVSRFQLPASEEEKLVPVARTRVTIYQRLVNLTSCVIQCVI